jgi:exopolyphosphatase/guanosine-5'-triphosphate,3'-diphosphate pyrophosphatase
MQIAHTDTCQKQKPLRIAAIDIGTMSTRLMIADVSVEDCVSAGVDDSVQAQSSGQKTSRVIRELYRDLRVTQLGLGLNVSGLLSSKGVSSVLAALGEYVQLTEQFQVDDLICVATSAIRDAKNASLLTDAAMELGIDVVIIPGEVEAQLAFLGATYEPRTTKAGAGEAAGALDLLPTLVVDSGGGSTELALGRVRNAKAEIIALDSMQLGARRLTDMFIDGDPPRSVEVKGIRSYVQKMSRFELQKYAGKFDRIVAVAGTATTLAAVLGKVEPYRAEAIQGCRVTREDLENLLSLFVSKRRAEREKIVGLDPKRAGVIVAGTLILESVLDALDCEEFYVSDRDLLYGMILSALDTIPEPGN